MLYSPKGAIATRDSPRRRGIVRSGSAWVNRGLTVAIVESDFFLAFGVVSRYIVGMFGLFVPTRSPVTRTLFTQGAGVRSVQIRGCLTPALIHCLVLVLLINV